MVTSKGLVHRIRLRHRAAWPPIWLALVGAIFLAANFFSSADAAQPIGAEAFVASSGVQAFRQNNFEAALQGFQ